MHFLLIGATGRVGSATLNDALERGHTVTALVRNPANIQARTNLTLSKGSSMSGEDVDAAFTAATNKTVDAVLVTLNIKRESGSPWSKPVSPANLMEQSITNIATAMKKYGVRKLVTLTAHGVGDSYTNLPVAFKAVVCSSSMAAQFQDHDNAHKVVKNDRAIDWVFLRPMRLSESPKATVKTHGDRGDGVGLFASCSIASVADFMVKSAETSTWDNQTPVLTN